MSGNLSDGDHPDNIVITYGRANAALEMVEDLCTVIPPERWPSLSLQMLDRDMLANDEWWAALQRRRFRRLQRPPALNLPSYSTRVTAGHILAAVVLGYEHQPESHIPLAQPTSLTVWDPWDYKEARQVAWERSGGACEAHNLHHRDCPGNADTGAGHFVTHHVYPRELAKRDRLPKGLVDHPDNLIVVWNGSTGLGAGGCHGRIHRERTSARRLGLLAPSLVGYLPATTEESSYAAEG